MEEIEELKLRIREMEQRPSEESVRERMKSYNDEVKRKEEEIYQLKQALIERDNERVDSASRLMAQEQYRVKVDSMQKEIEDRNHEIESLQAELAEMHKRNEDLVFKSRSEGLSMLEIEHLKSDNMKLVNLLKKTKEYKQFAEYIEDSGGAVHISAHSLSPKAKKSRKDARKDMLGDWVPAEVASCFYLIGL